MPKKLAVLVSLYNGGEWIENRLNNLFESTLGDDMEVWCLNADSPDERDETIPKKFSKIKYIRWPKRIGVYAAWNKMIDSSNSLYITNANVDDIVAPNCYERLIKALETKGEPAGGGGGGVRNPLKGPVGC